MRVEDWREGGERLKRGRWEAIGREVEGYREGGGSPEAGWQWGGGEKDVEG